MLGERYKSKPNRTNQARNTKVKNAMNSIT